MLIKTKYHLGIKTPKCKYYSFIHSFQKKKKKSRDTTKSLKASSPVWAQTVHETSKVPTL